MQGIFPVIRDDALLPLLALTMGLIVATLLVSCVVLSREPKRRDALILIALAFSMLVMSLGVKLDVGTRYGTRNYSSMGFVWHSWIVSYASKWILALAAMAWLTTVSALVIAHVRLKRRGESGLMRYFVIFASVSICVAFPAFGSLRQTHPSHYCRRNFERIGQAINQYQYRHGKYAQASTGDPAVSWRVTLLPYIQGNRDEFEKYSQADSWDSERNLPSARQRILEYRCVYGAGRDSQGREYTAYAMVTGPRTISSGKHINYRNVKDGTANTVMIVDASGQKIVWTEPRDVSIETTPLGVNLPGKGKGDSPGIVSSHHLRPNVLLMDGSIRSLNPNADPDVIRGLLTIDDGDQGIRKEHPRSGRGW